MPYPYQDPQTGQIYYPQPQPQQPSSPVYPDWWPGKQNVRQTQQNQQSLSLPGRFVESEKDISPREVPMDNSVGVFPLSDFSMVLLKKWENNGTITTVAYKPDIPQKGPTPEQEFQIDIQQRLSKLEDMLSSLTAMWQTPTKEEQK